MSGGPSVIIIDCEERRLKMEMSDEEIASMKTMARREVKDTTSPIIDNSIQSDYINY